MTTAAHHQIERSRANRLIWDQADWEYLLEEAEHVFGTVCLTSAAPNELAPHELVSISRSILSSVAASRRCAALEFRYIFTPTGSQSTQVTPYVVAKTYAHDRDEMVLHAVLASVGRTLAPQYTLLPSHRPKVVYEDESDVTIIELRRPESVINPVYEFVPMDYLYVIDHELGDGSGWKNFWHPLPKIDGPVEVSILFKPTHLTLDEQNTCAIMISNLHLQSEKRVEPFMYSQLHYPADTNARMAYESWDSLLRKLQRCFLVRVAVRGPKELADPLALRLGSALSYSTEKNRVDSGMQIVSPSSGKQGIAARESFDWLEVYPWGGHQIWHPDSDYRTPHALRRFPYLFNLEDASAMAILPVSDERGAPGMTIGRRSSQRRQSITDGKNISLKLGNLLNYGQVSDSVGLSLDEITQHMLIVGAPGSGKTTTVLTILVQLWVEHKIPFVVIEPTKTEYRRLLDVDGFATDSHGSKPLHVIPIGRDDICAFRLNPLEPPPGVRLENHLSSLMATFNMALPLWDPLPQLLEESLEQAYFSNGWSYGSQVEDGQPVPSLGDLKESFDDVFAQAKYEGEAKNIASALRARLRSLMRGSRGRLTNTLSSNDFRSLLKRPVIIELDAIDNPLDKSLICSLILERIRFGCRERGDQDGLRHVTVLEEAHRIIPKLSSNTETSSSLQQRVVDDFCDAIAELRASGEGFIISSQIPSRLAPAAIANTSTRLLHRMVSSQDRDQIMGDVDLIEVDRPLAPRLKQGEALFRSLNMDETELIRVSRPRSLGRSNVPDDEAVREHMTSFSRKTLMKLPYRLCTREVCTEGCTLERRNQGERIAATERARVSEIVTEIRRNVEAAEGSASVEIDGPQKFLEAVSQRLVKAASPDRTIAYCAASHLNSEGDDFTVDGSIESVQRQLMNAMELPSGRKDVDHA